MYLNNAPTGALDSDTSVQIMDLLKEIATDRLVIMVTHNPELAEAYSTRIIKLKDGKVEGDTNPYDGNENTKLDLVSEKKNTKKKEMSLKTALSLSLNNLMTKKGRTILTAFAGSIGIIGIALILSLSNGLEEYIDKVQKESLSSYPLSIEDSTIDYSDMIESFTSDEDIQCTEGSICTSDNISNSPYIAMQSSEITNNLTEFKKYLDDNGGNINDYITDIQYVYDLDLQIYSRNSHDEIVKVNPNVESTSIMWMTMSKEKTSMLSNVFEELIDSSELLSSQYEVLSGRMPESYNELVLIVDEDNKVPLSVMYSLDIENREELTEIINKITSGEEVTISSINYNYDDLVGRGYKLILNTSFYQKEGNVWVSKYDLEDLYNNGEDLNIVGVIKVKEGATATSGYIGYTHALTHHVIDEINSAEIAGEQLVNSDINIFTGQKFDGFTSTYENNLKLLGIANIDSPKSINIYPKDFASKEEIKEIIKDYNSSAEEIDQIKYTDMVGVLMSGITTIIDVISYILIAFVAISLVVSSIMIAIITYISVLERTKEIGILRSIGASKKDVTRVFNAETLIEGLISGVMGIVVTFLLCIPINTIVNNLFGVPTIAKLPLTGAIILIIISTFLTVIAGLVPARMASKRDPVTALRSE